jgi:hypothetical protein
MTTWSDLVTEARQSIEADHGTREDRDTLREWIESGDWHDAAHEYADGHSRVIYYAESRALFADGLLDDYEDEAQEIGDGTIDTIDRWISMAAYCALRSAYLEAVSEYLDEYADELDDGEPVGVA